jgi:UTP--glucose-1-phosphate uridylyltransferase
MMFASFCAKRPIRTAVFPVAGLGTRFLPATKAVPKEMLPVLTRPVIQYALDEAKAAGCDRFIFITAQGKEAIEDYFDRSLMLETFLSARNKVDELATVRSVQMDIGQAVFIRQHDPLGPGYAVLYAQHFVGDEPFALLFPDDLILGDRPCLQQMIETYTGGNMVAVMEVEPCDVSRYGILDLASDTPKGRCFQAKSVVEKPQIDASPSCMAIIGRYILDPAIFDVLRQQGPGAGSEIQLTDALDRMIATHPLYGYQFQGQRFDCGTPEGWLETNVTLACQNPRQKKRLEAIIHAASG